VRDHWREIWQKLNAPEAPQDVLDALIRAYSSPDRFYHNLMHIEDCLSIFGQAKHLAAHPEEVELAIWFHDSVYDTRRNDNEQKSAELASSVIRQAGLSEQIAERISLAILATRHNTEVSDRDAQMLVDVDLSILGRDKAVFWLYEGNIRKEYAWVPASIFRPERMEILRRLLECQHIYYCEIFREMFEERARVNITRAIARLADTTNTV
jgi:predicted metal-dependent HD superfamily phosphohydrolase